MSFVASSKNMLRRVASFRSNLLLFLVFVTGLFSGKTFRHASPAQNKSVHLQRVDSYCDRFHYPQDLVIIVKSGANEIYEKLPTQLLTSLSCYQDVLVFSDLEQQFAGHHIHDALQNVPMTIKRGNPEFNYYLKLQYYKKHGKDVGRLRESDGSAAWDLDKYKFLHMLEDTWNLRPGRKWYFFLEADTYLVQPNLFHWLERMDPAKPLYFGSIAFHKAPFAHGGSGFLLSGAALAKYISGEPTIINQYDEMMKREPFGDYVLSQALGAKGVKLVNASPMLSAEKPVTLPFGPGPAGLESHWCRPIVTMHHITPQEASMLWEVEQRRPDPTVPLTYEELFAAIIKSNMAATRDDWDNMSDHVAFHPPGVEGDHQKPFKEMTAIEKQAHLSFENCARACDEDPRCYQYRFSSYTCSFAWYFRLGTKREPEEGKTFQSGWNLRKIAQYQRDHVCTSPAWI